MFCFDSILFQTIVAAAIHKCPENLLVWQKIQVKQIKGYTFCINMSFTAKFLGEYLIKDVSLLTKQIISFFPPQRKPESETYPSPARVGTPEVTLRRRGPAMMWMVNSLISR